MSVTGDALGALTTLRLRLGFSIAGDVSTTACAGDGGISTSVPGGADSSAASAAAVCTARVVLAARTPFNCFSNAGISSGVKPRRSNPVRID